MEGPGAVRQARSGGERHGGARWVTFWLGRAGEAWRFLAWLGMASQGRYLMEKGDIWISIDGKEAYHGGSM
jgi:hypothetical protein